MRLVVLSDGLDTLEADFDVNKFRVFLTSEQVRVDCLDQVFGDFVLAAHVPDTFSVVLEYGLVADSKQRLEWMKSLKTRLDKLRFIQKLFMVLEGVEGFKVPFIHPDNVVVVNGRVLLLHFGFVNLVAPFARVEEHFLQALKAFIGYVFNSNVSFEVLASGALVLEDDFSKKVNSFKDFGSLRDFIDEELVSEEDNLAKNSVLVSKKRYFWVSVLSVGGVFLAFVLTYLVYAAYSDSVKYKAVVSAQDYFLAGKYSSVFSTLDDYPIYELPKGVRFVLAQSAVNLSDFDVSQKQKFLGSLSLNSSDTRINFWVYVGRGNFEDALNLAQNLNDKDLMLLAYRDLYDSTKSNTAMDGSAKQKLLNEYEQKISELGKALDAGGSASE